MIKVIVHPNVRIVYWSLTLNGVYGQGDSIPNFGMSFKTCDIEYIDFHLNTFSNKDELSLQCVIIG